jgi:hypothetical protein
VSILTSVLPYQAALYSSWRTNPPHVVNRLGQAVVPDHVLDRQTLDANRLVLANNAGGELLLVVATAIGNPSVNACDFAPSLLTIARAFFLLGKATLCAGQLLLVACKELGIADGFTIGGDDHRLEAQVQPNALVDDRLGGDVFFHANGDEVAAGRIFGDSNGRGGDSFWQRARPPDVEWVLHLGQAQDLSLPGEGRAGILGGLLVMACLKFGIGSTPLKEVGESLIEMAQGLLGWHTGHFIEKGGFRLLFEHGQASRQLSGSQAPLLRFVGLDAQAQRPIVNVAHTAERTGQNLLLFCCRVKPILVGPLVLAHRLLALSLFLEMLFDRRQDLAIERAIVLFGCLSHLLQETFRKPDGKSFHVIFHVTNITPYCNYVKGLVPHSPGPKQGTPASSPCLKGQGYPQAEV